MAKRLFVFLVVVLVGAFGWGSFTGDQVGIFTTPNPNGHPEWVSAINHAQKSIRMEMYHLDDPQIVDALIAAQQRGVSISLIIDKGGIKDPKMGPPAEKLKAAGVPIRASSPAFSITHVKAIVIDQSVAYVTSINLTMGFAFMRDYGVVTQDPAIIAEMNSVFFADWNNAVQGTGNTPPLTNPNLLWSPVNSESKLVALINSATKTIYSTVENLGDPAIQAAFVAAADRGVDVRIIVPECDLNPNPAFNFPFLYAMKNVKSRVMPPPSTPEHPYIHGKMILVDQARAYVGSVNFSLNSTQHARELGILFQNQIAAQKLVQTFVTDWNSAIDTPSTPPTDCPKMN